MAPPLRIASLLPSATEIVCALGARESLVGVSHECDYPADVVGLPILTKSHIRVLPRSADIDRDVRALVRDVLAVYELELDVLRELEPDVIVTQDLCDVCAVSFDDVCRAAQDLANPDLVIESLHPKRLADVILDVGRVGRAIGREREAEEVIRAIEGRIERVRERALPLERPSVLTIEWLDPVMIGGTWMPELVELAGGTPLVTRPGDHAPTLTIDQLADLKPDVVLIKPCGFDLERTLAERSTLVELLERVDWPAVREGRVFVADGNAFFNRPGPRLADSLEILAACIHPDAFADLAGKQRRHFELLTP